MNVGIASRGKGPLKFMMTFTVATALLLSAIVSMAQMRPGAKVEKTYGFGLPRNLLIDDHEYPDYPLKPGQESYKDVDGYRIKELLRKFTAISLKSQDKSGDYGLRPTCATSRTSSWDGWRANRYVQKVGWAAGRPSEAIHMSEKSPTRRMA